MHIELSKRDYLTLLEILDISDWVLHAHRTGTVPSTAKYAKLEQKIFSLAGQFECDDLIEYSDEMDEYFPTRQFEETSQSMELVREFEDDSFWDELIDRLAGHDLLRELGKEAYEALEFGERLEKEIPLMEKWTKEFETHGLKRLGVVER